MVSRVVRNLREGGGVGQDYGGGEGFGCERGVLGVGGRTSGGARVGKRLSAPGLVEMVFRNGLRVGGIEVGTLVEVVGGGFLGGLFLFPTAEIHSEVGLGWPPGGMEV